ncbi:MAG: hypothetical protein QM680_05615 [Luteolibacter sp.]
MELIPYFKANAPSLSAIFTHRAIGHFPVVALPGSRQVEKTTLAKDLDFEKTIHDLDLERPSDLANPRDAC